MWNEALRKEKQRRGTEGEWSGGALLPLKMTLKVDSPERSCNCINATDRLFRSSQLQNTIYPLRAIWETLLTCDLMPPVVCDRQPSSPACQIQINVHENE